MLYVFSLCSRFMHCAWFVTDYQTGLYHSSITCHTLHFQLIKMAGLAATRVVRSPPSQRLLKRAPCGRAVTDAAPSGRSSVTCSRTALGRFHSAVRRRLAELHRCAVCARQETGSCDALVSKITKHSSLTYSDGTTWDASRQTAPSIDKVQKTTPNDLFPRCKTRSS